MNNLSRHQSLRVPEGWSGQARALVIQVDNEIAALQMRIDRLEKKLKEMEDEQNGSDE